MLFCFFFGGGGFINKVEEYKIINAKVGKK